MSALITRLQPDRSHIDTGNEAQVRFWAKHFHIETGTLLKAVDKVGNCVATVRKELGVAEDPSGDDADGD